MVAEGRQDAILRELELHGSMQVTAFASRHGVSPMTVRRDLARLEDLGLLERVHGGAISRSVATQRSRADRRDGRVARPVATIGMVVPSADYYYPAVIQGAQAAARDYAVRLVLGTTNYSVTQEVRQAERLLRGGVDGLLITPASQVDQDSPVRELLATATKPVVVVEREVLPGPGSATIESVRTDHAYGAELAMQHLYELGHRRVLLAARTSATAPWLRLGHRRVLERNGEDPEGLFWTLPNPRIGTDDLVTSVEQLVEHCVQQGVRAVVIHNDTDAMAFVDLAAERGFHTPRDFSIVAYDDEFAALAQVPITAVAPPKFDLGHSAMRMCFERLTSRTPASAVIRATLIPTLVQRESTAS